jgi:hypothetical protein
MSYENISFRKRNLAMVDGYFYMMDENQDAMIVKTDDGTQAYSYPLDTTISNQVVSMEYDGRNFWTMENPDSDDCLIKRWNFENYVLKQRDEFEINRNASHRFDSNAMTVEHYHLHIKTDVNAPSSTIQMYMPFTKQAEFDLVSQLQSGFTISLGPNRNGQREDISVNSVSVSVTGSNETIYTVNLNGTTTYDYDGPTASGTDYTDAERYGDPASFYSTIWLFNNYNGLSSDTGALYSMSAYTEMGGLSKVEGGEYQGVDACTFFDVPNYIFDRTWQDPTSGISSSRWHRFHSIVYARTTNLIFLNPEDLNDSRGSMTIDNVESDQATVIDLYDMTMEGVNIYRLQRKATYYGTTYTFANNTYNYQLSTLEPFITSISLRANPAILPANGVSSSRITAIVKDQFNLPLVSKPVTFTEDDPNGSLSTPNPASTDIDGTAYINYQAGNSAREVKITATAQQGGVDTPED